MFYVEFPSFALATAVVRVLSPHQLINGFFVGISGGGWLLVAVMLFSFLQWYLLGWVGQKLWQRWFRHNPSGALETRDRRDVF
jgi:high-affinity Fe2+/Pb2+ permease